LGVIRKQSSVVRGHREKERRAIVLDIGEDGLSGRTARRKDRGSTAGKRKIAGVAQAVGEKQPSDAEAAVVFIHPEDALRVQLGTNDHVVMQMNASLGGTRAAGGIEPECSFILARWLGGEIWRRRAHDLIEAQKSVRWVSSNDHVPQIAKALLRNRAQQR